MSPVLQVLAGLPQVKGLCLPYCLVRVLLLHQPYQVFFYRGGPGETLPGRALHSTVHIGRQDSVVGDKTVAGELGHGVPDALTGKAGDTAELVGGDALVAVGVDQAPYDLDQLLFVGIVRIVEAQNASPGLFHALDLERGREDGHFILMPGEVVCSINCLK